jgi:hypothetical protein
MWMARACLQVARVLDYAHENQVDAFLEPTAELCLALLERDAAEAKRMHAEAHRHSDGGAVSTGANAALASNALSHIVFSAQGESALSHLGAECLRLLSRVRPSPPQRPTCLAASAQSRRRCTHLLRQAPATSPASAHTFRLPPTPPSRALLLRTRGASLACRESLPQVWPADSRVPCRCTCKTAAMRC